MYKELDEHTDVEEDEATEDKEDVEKEVAYLAKNFQKILKMKNNGKSFGKGKFSSSKNDKKRLQEEGCKRVITTSRECLL